MLFACHNFFLAAGDQSHEELEGLKPVLNTVEFKLAFLGECVHSGLLQVVNEVGMECLKVVVLNEVRLGHLLDLLSLFNCLLLVDPQRFLVVSEAVLELQGAGEKKHDSQRLK